ncbi:decarboxylase [Streptomyces sp. BE308]|uniref:maleate cis-trans isomerase family protein n=1 Tax=Streptomyces sp. BE308 TaxID=3002529 RepID=UPI002E77C770|nr:decarboxylase [Streptomyces sp. BE308]MEE1796804.1 decarboxylase [Streptomyces sp. BE308]
MTTVGLLYPGHSAEGDFQRIEIMLDSDIRLPLFHTDTGEDARRVDRLRDMGAPGRLDAGVEELRLAGAEALVWACAEGSFVYGWEGAHEQTAALARAAGLPASSTSFGFVHAVGELGAGRVAVAATYPEDIAGLFTGFLKAGGVDVVAGPGGGIPAADGPGGEDAELVKRLAVAGDHPDAEAVLFPDTALHTAAYIPELEELLGKPVLTASQVAVWEGLRLADRRAWSPELGTLFATRVPPPGTWDQKGIEVRE